MKNSEYIEQALKLKLNSNSAYVIDTDSSVITLKKGQHIINEGDKSSSVYYIISGIVRGYYIDDNGEDITKCFSGKNQFCGTEGLRGKDESSFSIQCLDESRLIKLSYASIERIMKHDEEFKNKVNSLFLNEVTNLENRARSFLTLNAEQRYINFCTEYPELLKCIDLKYIASYIGVRPASLSRIRNNLKDNI